MNDSKDKKLINGSLLFAVIALVVAFVLSVAVLFERIIAFMDSVPYATVAISRSADEDDPYSNPSGVLIERSENHSNNTISAFNIKKDEITWSTDTSVEIFRSYYKDGANQIDVLSARGDNVLAPGTDNRFVLRVMNDKNIKVDYTVTAEAYYSHNDKQIPVIVRFSDSDGKYMLGSEMSWTPVMNLNTLKVSRSLSPACHEDYCLDWQWPFESGNDVYDTYLGNSAVNEDITLTVKFKILAKENTNPNTNGGKKNDGTNPRTGETFNLVVWSVIAVVTLAVLIVVIILFKRRRKKDEQNS